MPVLIPMNGLIEMLRFKLGGLSKPASVLTFSLGSITRSRFTFIRSSVEGTQFNGDPVTESWVFPPHSPELLGLFMCNTSHLQVSQKMITLGCR